MERKDVRRGEDFDDAPLDALVEPSYLSASGRRLDERTRFPARHLGETYGLAEHRARQHAAPRARKAGTGTVLTHGMPGYSGLGASASAEWLVGPGDDPFLTQSLQAHTVDLAPGGKNEGHGHQNEALY